MDNSIHEALRVINESNLNDTEKHECRHFLKRNRNEAPFIIDAKNRSTNDESVLSDFLRQMTIEDTQRKEMGYGNKSNYDDRNDYGNEYNSYNKQSTIDQRPDIRRGTNLDSSQQQQYSNEVNVFKNDNALNPWMTFEPGVDWTVVKHNLKLHSGWLKKKGDPTNRRVKAPFQGGDYSLVDMVPESKTITILYSSLFSFWDSEQKVKLKYDDTQDEVRKRIQNKFKFERRHFSLYHLREKGTKNYVNMDFDELDDSKQYELVIPWLAKLQRHTKEGSTSSSTSSKTKTNDSNTSNKGTTTYDSSTTKDKDNFSSTSSSSSPSSLSQTQNQLQSAPSAYQSSGLTNNSSTSNTNADPTTGTNNTPFTNQNTTYDPSLNTTY